MAIRINKDASKIRRKSVKLRSTKPPRTQRINYIKNTRIITEQLRTVGRRVKQMVADGIPVSLINDFIFTRSNEINAGVARIASGIADDFVGDLDDFTRERLINNVAAAFNIKASEVALFPGNTEIDTLTTLREVFVAENVELIKSIPPQYFKDLTQAVSANFRGVSQKDAKSLAGRIQDIGGVTDRRARFIARDQTAKVTTELSRTRNQALGAKKYIWRTAKDQRVVGTPGGVWPDPTRGHGNHFKREGNVYFYSKPFADGLPGQAFNCRCVDEPIIDIQELLA